ncbi:MAG TPA: CPBP family intramembrane metalloprotease [Desulfobacteraceae bacterium]|nr:CPBP family intramembrane metalloprotease [Desulfobacteraceae bacterium]
MRPKGDRVEAGKIKLKTFGLSLGAVIAAEVVVRLGVLPGSAHPMVLLGTVRLVEAGLIIAIVFLGEKGLASIGLSMKDTLQGLKRGFIWSAGFGLLVLLGGALAYVMGINPLSLIHTPVPAGPAHILLFFIVGGIIGPVTEEILFRGVLYGFFRPWGAVAAILLTTLAFVLAHPVFPAIPITQIVGGLLFAVAYEVEKNLMVPITLHSLGNMAIFGLSLT